MSRTIILYNMGGSASQEELKEFIFNLLSDKRVITSPARHIIAPIVSRLRYKKKWREFKVIGGSDIYLHTEKLAKKMEALSGQKVLLSMRYTSPKLKNIINGLKEVCIIPLYPHDSAATVGSFKDDLARLKLTIDINIVEPFFDNLNYNQLIANNIQNAVDHPEEWNLIMSAHGLPIKLIERGDLYQKHVESQVELLKKMLPAFKSIDIAYQSRFGNGKWLQPYLPNKLKTFKGKKVLIYPISFVIDNLETDHELKIEFKEMAEQIGIEAYKVVKCPNDQDEMAKILLQLTSK